MAELIVDAGDLARVYEVGDRGVHAVAIVSHGRRVPIVDRGPSVVVDGREVALRPAGMPDLASDGGRLTWVLEGDGVTVELEATAERSTGVIRTRLAILGRGRLGAVEPERWDAPQTRGPAGLRGPNAVAGLRGPNAVAGLRGPNAVAGTSDPRDLGQPLLGDGFYVGLEHPGAENTAQPEGGVRCRLPVAVDLSASTPYRSPPVVVGAAPLGRELSSFWDELDRTRARPARLVTLANNWYQLGAVGRMDEGSVRAEMAGFAALRESHGLDLDFYCLDDPWDGGWGTGTGIWGRMDPARFPGGLDALSPGGAGIGLWVSPWGGYFDRHDARTAWGRDHGFEVQEGSWPMLCPAGDAYRAHLAASLSRWTSAGVRYWKIDGVHFDCPDAGHGHAVGPAGRTDQMDRFAALLDDVRAVAPDVVLAYTSGSNPSPWWLGHADFLWRGGLDDDAPADHAGGRHDRFATYIDGCLDDLRGTALPVSAIVTFSLVENAVAAYRDDGGDPDAWKRHCWLMVGRGTHHHDLYVAPDSLSDEEWACVARSLAWARAHQPALARSRMVGGRPQAGEPYGFVSAHAGEAVVCLRNPSAHAREITLSGGELGGQVDDLEVVWGRAVLPRRLEEAATLTVELAPLEVVLAEGRCGP